MKRLLCSICLLSLLLTACASNGGADKTTKEYEHIPYVSSIEQKDCFLCGEPENALADLY